ncbi:MAG: type II toxin-antitoxin system RelE/ParE family toxin [Sphingomonas sp.]
MRTLLLTVVETTIFLRQAEKIWSEEERAALVDHIARNPEAGDVIPDTGGVRKMRWGRAGSGKRGGARVVYFYHHADAPLYLLLAYAKAQREDMTQDEKRGAAALVVALKQQHPSARKI